MPSVASVPPPPKEEPSAPTPKQETKSDKELPDFSAPGVFTSPPEQLGWYRVLYPSVLRAEPRMSAAVVVHLRKHTRVLIVHEIEGQWLAVRSVHGEPSGFLWSEDATAERENRAEGK